ncbi:uncharacterized protein [Rutidosis leptorrhynchoides]|uniref:uncharacterized protein n=1 Tax=Rutidosis leptorrhynchoides TaxID=125765 RepID=UPI003A998931
MATSSGPSIDSSACHELKLKSDDVGWKYGVLVDPKNKYRVKCKLCGHVNSAGIHRLKQHIAGVRGNVAACPKATQEDKLKCQNALDKNKSKKRGKRNDDEALRGDVKIGRNSINTVDLDEMEMEESFGDTSMKNVSGKKKTNESDVESLESSTREEEINYLKEVISRWVYKCGIPFDAIESDSFKRMLEAIGEYGPGAELVIPTESEMYAMFEELSKEEKGNMNLSANSKLDESSDEYLAPRRIRQLYDDFESASEEYDEDVECELDGVKINGQDGQDQESDDNEE